MHSLQAVYRLLAPLVCGLVVSFAAFGTSEASITTYALSNHPSGSAAPPTYGFRLDDLQGANSGDFTFSFDHPSAGMFLTYDSNAGTINIAGTAFGGLDIGNGWDTNNSGLFQIDFTYTVGVMEVSNGLIVDAQNAANTGTIELLNGNWLNGGGVTEYDLIDFQGNYADSFLFLADGHRINNDNSTIVGRGWVNHDGDGNLSVHNYASDWLFVGELVPEPGSILVWGGLALITGMTTRRRQR